MYKSARLCIILGIPFITLDQKVAVAQDLSTYPVPPQTPMRDQFGVNVLSATWTYEQKERLHSDIDPSLDFYLFDGDGGMLWGSSLQAYVSGDATAYQTDYNVVIGHSNYPFRTTAGSNIWTDNSGYGNTLTYNTYARTFTFTKRDGTRYIFDTAIFNSQPAGGTPYCVVGRASASQHVCGAATSATFPDGKTLTFEYDTSAVPLVGSSYQTYARLRAAHSSNGISVLLSYSSWFVLSSAEMINDSYEFCNYTTSSCGSNYSWPTIGYNQIFAKLASGRKGITMTTHDQLGNQFLYETSNYAAQFRAYKAGGGVPAAVNFDNDQGPHTGKGGPNPPGYINYTGPDGIQYRYTYVEYPDPNGGHWLEIDVTRTSTDGRIYSFIGNRQLPRSTLVLQVTDELNRVTNFSYDSHSRPAEVDFPEGNSAIYTYDTNGNVTELRDHAKPGSGLADNVQTAIYPSSCSGPLICNKPISVTDARNNTVNYTWDQNNGNILTRRSPPNVNGVSAVVRYTYANRYALISNGLGGFTQSPYPRSMLIETRSCANTTTIGNSCAGGTSDEIVTAYDYGPPSGPNNLLLRGKSVSAAGVTLLECYHYDRLGHKISVTKPNGNGQVCL